LAGETGGKEGVEGKRTLGGPLTGGFWGKSVQVTYSEDGGDRCGKHKRTLGHQLGANGWGARTVQNLFSRRKQHRNKKPASTFKE